MKNIRLKYKIIGGLIIAIILLLAIKPNIAKKLYKKAIDNFNTVDAELVKELEELKSIKEKDSIYYEEALRLKDEYYEREIIEANEKYYWLNNKYKQNEKELDNYRNASFDDKFILFSGAITGKDSI